MTSKKLRALEVAIDILGTEGVRALTHRNVDARAALPAGSTSNYFRTRAALLQGVVEHMVAVEVPEVSEGPDPRTPDELAEQFIELYEIFTGPNRTMTAARLALFVEAGHDEALRDVLARGRTQFERVLIARFASVGAPDPRLATQMMAACFEGLFLHSIGGHAEVDARGVIEAVVRAAT